MGPLHGLKVLELGGIGPVPFACMMLSDAGADIARIDRAASAGPDEILDPLMRGRPRFVVDLRDPRAIGAVLNLVALCDVVVEGFGRA